MRRRVLGSGALAAWVALGVAMQAQPLQERKPEAPAAAPQQDRLEFGGVLDTWYKIESGPVDKIEHVGFSRERISRQAAGSLHTFDYESETVLDLLVEDPKDKGKAVPRKTAVFESSIIKEARLDDTYAPSGLNRLDDRNGSQIASTVGLSEGRRNIRVSLSPTQHLDFKVSPDEEIYYSRFLMFIALRQNDNLSKPGARKAIVFHPREDGTVPTAEVQFDIGNMVKREYLDKKEVSVTPITFIKPPPASTRDSELVEAYVDRYGRVVEEVTRGGLRKIIAKDREAAIPPSLMVRSLGRRDPFDKTGPLGAAGKVEDDKAKGLEIVAINPNNFQAKLQEAQKLIGELRKARDENREQEAEKIYQQIVGFYAGFHKSNRETPQPADVMAQVEALRTAAEEIFGGEVRLVERLRQVYTRAMDAFQRDQCDALENGIKELRESEAHPILQGRPARDQVTKWITDLVPRLSQCRTRIELAKKQIVLSGTTISEERIVVPVDPSVRILGHAVGAAHPVRFVKPVKLAVINDKTYRVGDLVEGLGVRVEKIWAFGVQVSLKEETREVGIRQ